ncbi:MAG TPA: DUF1549 domain-containing protein [Labilithrix sp.]
MRKTLLIPFFFALLGTSAAHASPTLDEYRHFRALSVDLEGRVPTRDEVKAFEQPGFDLDGWIDARLAEPGYADRVSRIYMDLLRLQVSPVFKDSSPTASLHRAQIVGPDGSAVYVFYRVGQRRTRNETDGDFCMTPEETGLQFPALAGPIVYDPQSTGRTTGIPVSQATLDANTVVVKPWWLYRDFQAASPSQAYDDTWADKYGFQLAKQLSTDPDGKTQSIQIRVCKEEAQTADTGAVTVTGRAAPPPGTPPPYGRLFQLPLDSAYAKAHTGAPISCRTTTGFQNSAECGCGVGLQHCFPVGGANPNSSASTVAADLDVFGADVPVDMANQSMSDWNLLWLGEEARHFMQYLFGEDRDMRELLSAPYTFVNGPLAQYYKDSVPASCCGPGANLGYDSPVPLLDPAALPTDLLPHDTRKWELVPTRSAQASGLLTMPVFLTKFGTRRSKAHVLYNAFLCKDFIAPPNLQLTPSTDPNLMTRPGCSTCHATLEPMAAYFSRIVESDVTFLPKEIFPVDTKAACSGSGKLPSICQCKADPVKGLNGNCATYFDPAFSDTSHAVLRGSYPDALGTTTGHTDAGPQGMAAELAANPDFTQCVAQNVARSFLGRSLGPDDAQLQSDLANALGSGGFKMRAVVRAMLKSDAYRKSNNLSASAWRAANGGQ